MSKSKDKELQEIAKTFQDFNERMEKQNMEQVKDLAETLSETIANFQKTRGQQDEANREPEKQEQSEGKKISKKAPAENAEEFIQKYYRRRAPHTPSDPGKAYLLNMLFDRYSRKETGEARNLWDMEQVKSYIQTEEDAQSYNAYYYLTEWLRNLYETANTTLNSLYLTIARFCDTVSSILSGEELRNALIINKQFVDSINQTAEVKSIIQTQDKLYSSLTIALNKISIDAYTPQTNGGITVNNIRANISEDTRFIIAYNTFIDIVADFTAIPECACLKIETTNIQKDISILNDGLEILRDMISAHREPEIREANENNKSVRIQSETKSISFPTLYSLTLWTPEYLKATMEQFMPVGDEPPIPDKYVNYLKTYIRRKFKTDYINWYVLFLRYSLEYRAEPSRKNASSTGRKSKRSKPEGDQE